MTIFSDIFSSISGTTVSGPVSLGIEVQFDYYFATFLRSDNIAVQKGGFSR